ncbi:conserved hypothetical protein [Mesorhizobium plurifarium]|uniref:ATP-binding protein n=1 Tax=Mesorhizobium plurifarium TaxID=69974 RepID=A0A090FWX6_MESPL|nr:conserved hypothetical protein [Mesorhizobium plurifarium]
MEGTLEHDILSRRAAYGECEQVIDGFARRSSVLTVPNKWPFEARPGGSAAGAQLAISWARSNDQTTLQLASDEAPEDAARSLLHRTYGLVATLFADRIIGRDGHRDVTSGMLRLAVARLRELYSGELNRIIHGGVIALLSMDHIELDGPNPLLYQPISGAVRDDFQGVVNQALRRLVSRQRLRLNELEIDIIAGLLKELFSNTHVHARTDLNGALYRRSARGVLFALRPVEIPSDSHTGGLPGLRDYYASMVDVSVRPRVEFLEVSVFDSGPGLAARALGKPIDEGMSIDHEYDLVRECFLKNFTTQNDPSHGLGLPRVMQALKACGGFMRLRTGRLSLCKWFPPQAENVPFLADDARLIDTSGAKEIKKYAAVAGASFSILIPMGLGS